MWTSLLLLLFDMVVTVLPEALLDWIDERSCATLRIAAVLWLVTAFVAVYLMVAPGLPQWLYWVLAAGGLGSFAMAVFCLAAAEHAQKKGAAS